MPAPFIIVLTTLPNRSEAQRLSRLVLKEKLAACVNQIGPLRSSYWWKEKIETAQEFLLVIKTRSRCYAKLENFLKKHHPYDVPEILSLPIQKGNRSYLDWLKASIRS